MSSLAKSHSQGCMERSLAAACLAFGKQLTRHSSVHLLRVIVHLLVGLVGCGLLPEGNSSMVHGRLRRSPALESLAWRRKLHPAVGRAALHLLRSMRLWHVCICRPPGCLRMSYQPHLHLLHQGVYCNQHHQVQVQQGAITAARSRDRSAQYILHVRNSALPNQTALV